MATRQSTKNHLTLTWFGHSAFHVETVAGKSILIDPWLDNPKAPAGAKDINTVDLILLTHGHCDHIGNTIDVARRTGAKVIAIHEVALYLKAAGVAGSTGMNKGGTIAVDGISVTMTDAKHSSDIDVNPKLECGGEAAGFILTLEDGYTLYHAGDTALFGDMRLIGELYAPSLVLLPIGDLYTMGPREAAYACKLLKPKTIIGMHYGTYPVLAGTPTELKKHLSKELKNRVLELTVGTPVTL